MITNRNADSGSNRHWISEWTITVLMLLFGTTTALQAYIIPTGSMTNTLLVGDYKLVDKLAYSPAGPIASKLLPYRDIERGDIIVFHYPLNLRETYVKRVIGVPGDRIRFENKQLIRNGKRVPEPYVRLLPLNTSDYMSNFPRQHADVVIERRALEMLTANVIGDELVVPAGQYFALGDNRDESADSRFWGLVPRENITGTPVVVVWSYDAPTEQLSGGFLNPRHIGDVMKNFATKTRWDRTLRLIHAHDFESSR